MMARTCVAALFKDATGNLRGTQLYYGDFRYLNKVRRLADNDYNGERCSSDAVATTPVLCPK